MRALLTTGLLMALGAGLWLALAECVAVISRSGAAMPPAAGMAMLATWLAVPYAGALFLGALPPAVAIRALSGRAEAFGVTFAGVAFGVAVLIWMRTIGRLGADPGVAPLLSILMFLVAAAAGAGVSFAIYRTVTPRRGRVLAAAAFGVLACMTVLVVLSRPRRGPFGAHTPPLYFPVRLALSLVAGVLLAVVWAWVARSMARRVSALWLRRFGIIAVSAWVLWCAWGFNNTILSHRPTGVGSRRPAPAMAAQENAARRPNIMLISIDTLRSDHLSCYGRVAGTSPHIDALAQEGVRFEKAFSTASFTLPAHASMMTGLFPSTHGATYQNRDPDTYVVRGLSPGHSTMAELLRDAGYDTAGFASGPLMSSAFGFGRGFDLYDDRFDRMQSQRAQLLVRTILYRWMTSAGFFTPEDADAQRTGDDVTRLASAWLAGRHDTDRPFFLFTHYWDPHGPYKPPHPYDLDPNGREMSVPYDMDQLLMGTYTLTPAALRDTLALYNGEIRWMDTQVGLLLEQIAKAGELDDTLVILTSDHGESFGEHDHWEHSRVLYEDLLHVPFIIRLPRGAMAGRVEQHIIAQPSDILPTVLSATGLPAPPELEGRDLLALLSGKPPASPLQAGELAFAELDRNVDWPRRWGARFDRDLVAARAGSWKYIKSSAGTEELFDLAADPGELVNLAGREPETLAMMRKLVEGWRTTLGAREGQSPSDIDEGLKENLRSLGYIQ